MDDAFGYWFSGFVDGEGHFDVRHTPSGSIVCRFIIGLRANDLAILEECRDTLGIGKIRIQQCKGGIRTQARWSVDRKADVAKLVAVLDRYPLRAKKRNDFALWKRAVGLWMQVRSRRRHDWTEMQLIAAQIREVRRFDSDMDLPIAPPELPQLKLVA